MGKSLLLVVFLEENNLKKMARAATPAKYHSNDHFLRLIRAGMVLRTKVK
jgi:hypothetical protein